MQFFQIIFNYLSFHIVPPQLVISPGDQTVNESDTLLVLCNASGNPAPHITWTKVGMTGPPTATGNRMKIANVSHEKHDGIYECTASNGIGKNATVLFKVTVNCRYTYGVNLLRFSC